MPYLFIHLNKFQKNFIFSIDLLMRIQYIIVNCFIKRLTQIKGDLFLKNYQLKMWIVSALFAAVIAIFAQLTIPLPLIPITGQTFAIGLAVTILGLRYGFLSVLLYIFLGLIGVPVFSGMTGGLGIITGPTGGYIIGFLPAAILMGIHLKLFGFTKTHAIMSNVIGMLITLFVGSLWLKFYANLSWTAAFTSGISPFLIVGLIKAMAAALVGITVRKRLIAAKLLQSKIA